jgi:hypothetical protein
MNGYRIRFWVESVTAALSGFLAIITLAWRDWIEATTGFSPDRHNGSFEWLLVAGLAVVSITCALLARAERRLRVDPAVGYPLS